MNSMIALNEWLHSRMQWNVRWDECKISGTGNEHSAPTDSRWLCFYEYLCDSYIWWLALHHSLQIALRRFVASFVMNFRFTFIVKLYTLLQHVLYCFLARKTHFITSQYSRSQSIANEKKSPIGHNGKHTQCLHECGMLYKYWYTCNVHNA